EWHDAAQMPHADVSSVLLPVAFLPRPPDPPKGIAVIRLSTPSAHPAMTPTGYSGGFREISTAPPDAGRSNSLAQDSSSGSVSGSCCPSTRAVVPGEASATIVVLPASPAATSAVVPSLSAEVSAPSPT